MTAPDVLPTARETLGPILHGWAQLARDPVFQPDPWTAAHLDQLIAAEREWLRHADGTALLHTDIRGANLVADETGHMRIVDWAHACRGAPWIDTVELMSHLVVAGHSPTDAESALTGTILDRTRPEPITSFIVASAGYWRRSSIQPPPPHAPDLRDFQARAANAATRIIRYRTARSD